MNTITRRILTLSVVLAVAASLDAGGATAAEVKRSGTITEIAADRITIAEMGPWTGDERSIERRSIAIGPPTKIERSERSEQPTAAGWPGGFAESALGPRDLHVGDYITVTVDEDGGRAVAKSITVTPPAEEAPSASILER